MYTRTLQNLKLFVMNTYKCIVSIIINTEKRSNLKCPTFGSHRNASLSFNERIRSSIFSLLCRLHQSDNILFINYLHADIHFNSSMYSYWRSLLYITHFSNLSNMFLPHSWFAAYSSIFACFCSKEMEMPIFHHLVWYWVETPYVPNKWSCTA